MATEWNGGLSDWYESGCASMRLWPDGHRMHGTAVALGAGGHASMRLWPDGHRMTAKHIESLLNELLQ